MKKYLFFPAVVAAILLNAQTVISFESSEGFISGNLHGQNSWEVTESSEGIIQNQIISNEQASNGSFSFKNGHQPEYDFQWFPIFGANRNFETAVTPQEEFSISYDIMVTGQQGADFEFTLYGVNENDEFEPVAGVGIENRGFIYLIIDGNYGFEYADAIWETGEWINVRVEVNSFEISYYINDEIQAVIPRFNQHDILGMNFLHNNYGHDAYYDNIVIERQTLSTVDTVLSEQIQIYPNPVTEVVRIQLHSSEISSSTVFDMTGKQIFTRGVNNEINIKQLTPGKYILQIITTDNKIHHIPFIKK